jgi:hypothetical protein
LPEISKVYYINLDKRADRKDEFLSNFSDSDKSGNRIERIQAVETPSNGALGCLLSHIKTLKRCIENNDKISFVCEDDLYIYDIKKLNDLTSYVIKNFKDWKVIMIGCNALFEDHATVSSAFDHEIKKINNAQTTSGYIIRSEYIPVLLEVYEDTYKKYSENSKWIERSYESDQCWKPLQNKDEWYSFYPRIAKQRESFSDIMGGVVKYECFGTKKNYSLSKGVLGK